MLRILPPGTLPRTPGHLGIVRVPLTKTIIPIIMKIPPPIKVGRFLKANQPTRAATTPAKVKPMPNHLIKALLKVQKNSLGLLLLFPKNCQYAENDKADTYEPPDQVWKR